LGLHPGIVAILPGAALVFFFFFFFFFLFPKSEQGKRLLEQYRSEDTTAVTVAPSAR
jgi:hypothetical protein